MQLSRFLIVPIVVLTFLVACEEQADIHARSEPKEPPPGKEVQQVRDQTPDRPAQSGVTLQWTLPEGWTSGGKKPMRQATLIAPGGTEFAVTRFPGDVGGVLANVNRWRGSVGLEELDQSGLDSAIAEGKSVRTTQYAGSEGYQVDFAKDGQRMVAVAIPTPSKDAIWFMKASGSTDELQKCVADFDTLLESTRFDAAPQGEAPPVAASEQSEDQRMAAVGESLPSEPLDAYSWIEPEGWEKRAIKLGFTKASFAKKFSGKELRLTLTVLQGQGGGVLPNINRWREQLGLAPLNEQQLLEEIIPLSIAGGPAFLVMMESEVEAPAIPEKIMAVIVIRRKEAWFVKYWGPANLIKENEGVLSEFLLSLKLK